MSADLLLLPANMARHPSSHDITTIFDGRAYPDCLLRVFIGRLLKSTVVHSQTSKCHLERHSSPLLQHYTRQCSSSSTIEESDGSGVHVRCLSHVGCSPLTRLRGMVYRSPDNSRHRMLARIYDGEKRLTSAHVYGDGEMIYSKQKYNRRQNDASSCLEGGSGGGSKRNKCATGRDQ